MRNFCKQLLILFALLASFSTAIAETKSPKVETIFGDTVIREFSARVIIVTDGDTIYVRDQKGQKHKVRLKAIDAPEDGQAYGRKSKSALAKLSKKKKHGSRSLVSIDMNGFSLM